MKNYSSSAANKLLIKYVLKAVITTIAGILLFSFLFSEITYKLDLDLDINNVFSIIIVFLCSALCAYSSVLGFKNNGAIMGIISQIPLIFYSVLNMIINENSWMFLLIKLVISLLTGALFGILASKKSAKFKVK